MIEKKDSESGPVSELRAATNAVALIQKRDERAWPIAAVLAEMWQAGCLRRLLKARGPAPVFVPTTEQDLIELFGAPDEVERRNRRSRAA